MTVRSLRRRVSCLSITRLPVQSSEFEMRRFGEQRMAMEGRCRTCHVCFERMSVLLQDDDGTQRNRVRRSFATDATTLRSQSKMQNSRPRAGYVQAWPTDGCFRVKLGHCVPALS